jgi:hypothetical protein
MKSYGDPWGLSEPLPDLTARKAEKVATTLGTYRERESSRDALIMPLFGKRCLAGIERAGAKGKKVWQAGKA